MPLDDFRTWIALHETTHAFEFEAHPWLRPYLRERLERQLAGFLEGARAFRVGGPGRVARAWPRPKGDLVGLPGAGAAPALRETQVVMSLLEGFSDWVMDEVGAELLPDVVIRRALRGAPSSARRGLDRIMARLTGLDLKLEQYRRGERFVAGVVAAGGQAAIGRLWEGPGALPTEAELDDPAAWVRRVLPRPWHERDRSRRTEGALMAGPGPGLRTEGRPAAIALTPILSARYRAADLARIRAAAPGSRLVSVSLEGLADAASPTSRCCCAGRCRRPSSTGCWRAAPACAGCTPRRLASSAS